MESTIFFTVGMSNISRAICILMKIPFNKSPQVYIFVKSQVCLVINKLFLVESL